MKKVKSKKVFNRKRMYKTNAMVKDFLLQRGFDEIWFKRHTRRPDVVYTQRGTYAATDLWNLFDGIAFSTGGSIWFLQMKTNAWAKDEPLKDFATKHNVHILSFNVSNKLKESNGKWKVFWRSFE